jgi:hypothetical protein
LNVATGKGFQFADGGTAGWVLTDDGTGLYVPAAAGAGSLPTPSGRGYILRSDATPAFVEYLANTTGAILVGDGTDITSDTTPTLVGNFTWQSGGSDTVVIRAAGDLTAAADIWLDGDGGISAEGSLIMLIDSDNSGTDALFEIAKDADSREASISGTHLWAVSENNEQIMRLNGISHNATSVVAYTDSWLQIENVAASGGTQVIGAKDSTGTAGGALILSGLLDEDADTTRSSAGRSVVEVRAGSESSTTWGNMVANGNVFGIRPVTGFNIRPP